MKKTLKEKQDITSCETTIDNSNTHKNKKNNYIYGFIIGFLLAIIILLVKDYWFDNNFIQLKNYMTNYYCPGQAIL